MGRSGNHLFTAIIPKVGKQSANAIALLSRSDRNWPAETSRAYQNELTVLPCEAMKRNHFRAVLTFTAADTR
jgi:hypothetical protein